MTFSRPTALLCLALLLSPAGAALSPAPALTAPASWTAHPQRPPALAEPTAPRPAAPPPATAPQPAASAPTTGVFTLRAPVGASVELLTTTTMRVQFGDVQASATPGRKVPTATLNRVRSAFLRGTADSAPQTVQGKTFFRVTGRAPDGTVTLVSTTVQSAPGEPPVTLRFTQQVAPGGQTGGLKIETDDAALGVVFRSLNAGQLEQLADQNGTNFTGVYGRPLSTGLPLTQSVQLDMQEMMVGLLTSIGGPEVGRQLGKIRSTPLTVTTTTRYQGMSAQGLHTFTQSSAYGPWSLSLPGGAGVPAMSMRIGDVQASGTQRFRADGLPGPAEQSLSMKMALSLTVEDVQLHTTLTLTQQTNLSPR